MDQCSHAEKDWFPQRTVCYKSMERAAASAKYDMLHEKMPYHDGTFKDWAKDRSPAHPYHCRDGVTIWVHDVDLTPEDDFLGSAVAPEEGAD